MKQKVFYSESSVKNGLGRSCINMSMSSGVSIYHTIWNHLQTNDGDAY